MTDASPQPDRSSPLPAHHFNPLKFVTCTLIVLLNTVYWALTCLLLSFTPLVHRYASIAGIWWGKINLVANGVRVRVTGQENLDPHESYMLIANHRSFVDVYTIYGYCGLNLRYVAKKELMKIPLFGYAMKRIGTIVVNRANSAEAIAEMNRVGGVLKKNGLSIATFAEGTRQDHELITPFKKGGFMLALSLGLPVVPVALWGTDRIQRKGDLYMHAGEVRISFLPPIETSGYTAGTIEELVEKVHAAIRAELERLSGEHG